jgi:2-polyprenyl-3-methyl-5-hydroxy-6-metoxy-1,4-benzoquinol methylase
MAIDIQYQEYSKNRLAGKHGVISSFFLVAPYLSGKRVLDIGCSDGLYLKLMSASEESIGIEQIPELAEAARSKGLKIVCSGMLEALSAIPSRSFEVVFLSHVLEHVEAPIMALKEINRVLVENGVLVLGLPTENNIFRKMFNLDYFDGTHLYAFTVKNSKKLLAHTGFRAKYVFYDLPKCTGSLGRLILKLYQRFPLKEGISMAYWIIAHKAR